ncbi:MAG TPA: sugar kinase [Rhodanobacteraceae bacterium]
MSAHPSSTGDRNRIVCFGELLMRLSAPGHERLLQTPQLQTTFGGAEANVAVSLAILGHRAAVVSTLPDNAIGHTCAGELRRHGVDVADICFDDGRMGLYFLSPGAMQRPSEVLYDRAGSAFAMAPADTYDWPRLLADAQWLHVSGITPALGDNTAQAALSAVRAARAVGTRVSFDCNYRGKLWGKQAAQAPRRLCELAAEADLLFGNDRDVALMLGMEFPQADAGERFRAAAKAAFATWPHLQRMATTGRHHHSVDEQDLVGMLADADAVRVTDAHALRGIVDRVGAGDAFAAGLLHGLLQGMDDAAALDFAVAAACLKHSIPGDVNLLGEEAVRAFLAGDGFEVKR